MSITRLAIRQAIAEETGLGFLVTATAGTSTTAFIGSGVSLTGPLSSQRFGRGSPMRVYSSAFVARGDSFVDAFNAATGTITMLPAVTGCVTTDLAEIWTNALPTVDRIDEAIDRGLTRHCLHWVPIPLTKVQDGDMGDGGITGLWTASVSTVSKVVMPWPGTVGQRYLRVLNAGYAASNAMPCQAGDQWRIDALAYVLTGTGMLVVYDNTNAAAITLSGDGGSYAGTGWKRLANTFTIPTGCETITVRLGATGATDDTYWTNIIAYPINERRFLLPARCTPKRLGRMLRRTGTEYEDFYFNESGHPWSVQGGGAGLVVQLSSAIGDPFYIEELRPYEALATDAAITECPDELAIKASIYEVYKGMAREKPTMETKSGYLTASDIKQNALDALRDMKGVQQLSADDRTVYR